MHYVDEGAGAPVVMVHGNPGWSFEFRKVIKGLSGTHRCIATDHIGFGLSDKPVRWDYLPEHHAANFAKLMDNLALTDITLVVSDWGGPIGLSYALDHPEKIRRIVVLNSWLWSVREDPYYRRFSGFMGGPIGRFLNKRFNFFGKAVVKKAMGKPRELTEHLHRHYYRHLAKPADREGCAVFPREIIGSSDWLDGLWQQRGRLKGIPLSLVWGMKDIAFRERELEHWITHWPEASVTRLPDIGHFPQEEAPEAVLEMLR